MADPNLSPKDYDRILKELADNAESAIPEPTGALREVRERIRRKTLRLITILAVFVILVGSLLFYAVRNAKDLPLGLGGIFTYQTPSWIKSNPHGPKP